MKKLIIKTCPLTIVICTLIIAAIAPVAAYANSLIHPQLDLNKKKYAPVCPTVPNGWARCLSIVNSTYASPNISMGYSPSDLRSAYNLTRPSATAGKGQTIAIVDAFDDPKAESDLRMYRMRYKLPSCTTVNGCFKKVDQRGGNLYPISDVTWSAEISLDLDMVSAICPNCHILLVEADDNSFGNLGQAVDEAAALNANVISNSYGGPESSDEISYALHYDHPGHIITASAGDDGYGVEVPAAFGTVTAVGGTTLTHARGKRRWSETAWNGAGSGCSQYIIKPAWQTDSDCTNRTVGDVSAVADPDTGVAVFDTYGLYGWYIFGGTSVSAPIIAGVYALAGNASTVTYGSSLYSHSANLYDVTSGSNGLCGGSYLCTAKPGYDGPTGLGTPKGITAF